MTLLCQPETHSLHFSLEHLCVFYDCHHSSTARRGVLIESLMRYYLFIFHKHLPLHSSSPSNSALWRLRLWHCQSVGVTPQKAGKVRCRDEERVLLSHISRCITWNSGPVWVAEAATHTTLPFPILQGQLSFIPGDARVGSCIVTLNLLILPHWLVGIPPPKDIPHELIGAKQCLRPSLKDYLKHLRSHTQTIHTPPVLYSLLFPCATRIKSPLKLHLLIHKSYQSNLMTN